MYYRATKIGTTWYVVEFDSLKEELEQIKALVDDGDCVLITLDLDFIREIADELEDSIVIVTDEE